MLFLLFPIRNFVQEELFSLISLIYSDRLINESKFYELKQIITILASFMACTRYFYPSFLPEVSLIIKF